MSDCIPYLNGKPTTYEALKKELVNNRSLLSKYVDGAKTEVPDMPFKKSWETLAMRRMIRYAAENGFDKITWDTGEIQAARYDLSKRVSKVEWNESRDFLTAYDHDGQAVISQSVTRDKLPEVIGKGAAEKLLNSEPYNSTPYDEAVNKTRAIEGEDLKVGGEGMKGFYDKILPSVANDIGKKFGAKSGEAKIPSIPYRDYLARIYGEDTSGPGIRAMERNNHLRDKWLESGSQQSVHSLDITPAMRESVMTKGQPLFMPDSPKKIPSKEPPRDIKSLRLIKPPEKEEKRAPIDFKLGTKGGGYNTPLSAKEVIEFDKWKAKHAPKDSGQDYDLRGAFKAGLKPKDGHWPDTFKKPNHPTFSDESVYADETAGKWDGEKFIPKKKSLADAR